MGRLKERNLNPASLIIWANSSCGGNCLMLSTRYWYESQSPANTWRTSCQHFTSQKRMKPNEWMKPFSNANYDWPLLQICGLWKPYLWRSCSSFWFQIVICWWATHMNNFPHLCLLHALKDCRIFWSFIGFVNPIMDTVRQRRKEEAAATRERISEIRKRMKVKDDTEVMQNRIKW